MWRELKHTIEDKSPTLEEHIAPVPAIVLDNVMSLSLHPQIEGNEGYTADPPDRALEFVL